MGLDGKMDVQLDVSKASRVSRLEVIEGPTGRRNRSAADKAKIAAESLVRGAALFAPLVIDEMPKTRAAVQPALAKLEIMVSDVVIRTEVEVEHLAGVILAMRASR